MLATSSFLATLVLLGAPQVTAEVSPGEMDSVRVSRCIVMLIDEVEVPARETGVLKQLALEDGTPVTEGLKVAKGQMLGKLDDEDALARKQAAEYDHQVAIAEEDKAKASIVAADATVLVADAEVVESEAINRAAHGSVPPTQIRRQKLTAERARTEASVARHDAKSAALTIQLRNAQVQIAELNLQRHHILSPLDGVVVHVHKHVGEWVNPGESILRIVYLDRVRVEGFVNIKDRLPEEIEGRPATIEVDVRKDRRMQTLTYPGVVCFVSPLVEATGLYRVWVEAGASPEGQPPLRPGTEASMVISVD